MAHDSQTILIFAANPSDQTQLRLDQEVREIQNGLRHSLRHFEVKQQWATRPKDLRRALLDHKPGYVHFCGHGEGAAGIVLEGQLVDGAALAGLFGLFADRIKCVVLNACYSSVQAHAIAQHIDCVVGMSQAIGDAAAIEFATAFYDALGAGESVEFAFDLGCNAIQLAGIPEHLTPLLITRTTQRSALPATETPTSRGVLRRDWDGAPSVSLLYGREADAEVLRSWIINELCRVVLITGLGGVGKTDLATCLGRGGNRSEGTSPTLGLGIHEHFEAVIWRTLLNAPTPEVLFDDMLGFLSEHRRAGGLTADKRIDELLACLQQRRTLIILDNTEAILQPGGTTIRYRPGYEPYGRFFEQIGKSSHQSCLLLTSREKPGAVADLEGARRPVRSLALKGIGSAESRHIFAQIGTFTGEPADWERIVTTYHGNPLALELAARHIDQVFGGDLSAFLSEGRAVFADIATLLDWHLDRLSSKETELVYWLAIEREPTSLVALYEDLVSAASRRDAPSTLQSLQRRIPIERSGSAHFTLQPVLLEHVTTRLVNAVANGIERVARQAATTGIPGEQSSGSVETLQALNSHALVKATAMESVRESQRRLILGPLAERLIAVHGPQMKALLQRLLDAWRLDPLREPGYVAGNLLNLIEHLGVDATGLNFSGLPVWQACLDRLHLRATDFSFAQFRHSTFRHPFGTVFSLAYSPDGQFLAVGDDNGEVRLFLSANGQFHCRFIGHSDVVAAVTFSPDGQIMASAGFDGTVRLWSVRDAQCINLLLGHLGWVYNLAFSPDGKKIASASEDGTCRIWDVASGQSFSPAVTEMGFVSSVGFSPDGQTLAVAGSSGVVQLFRLPDLAHPVKLVGHTGRVRTLAFSAQGDMLATAGEDERIHLWEPTDGVPIATLAGHSGSISSLSFSASGDVLASASMDHTVRLWSTARQECVGQLHVADARVWSVAACPNGRTVATGSEDGAIRVWNIDTCECLFTLRGYSNKTWSVDFAPDGPLLAAANEDALVRLWDVREARVLRQFRGHASRVWATACSPDGRWIASASDDLTVRIWDAHSGACLHILHGHSDWIRALCFSDADRLASAGEDGRIFVWNVATGVRLVQMQSVMPRVLGIGFCDSGRVLVAGGASDTVHAFATDSGQPIGQFKGHTAWVSTITAVDVQPLTFASCSEDGTVKFWNLTDAACLDTLAIGAKVWCGRYCDAGRAFLTGSDDGILRRWSLGERRCAFEARAHQGAVWSLATCKEGIVASAGNDGAIRLWRLADLTPYSSAGALRPERPYEGMNITAAAGLTISQAESLAALGAINIPSMP